MPLQITELVDPLDEAVAGKAVELERQYPAVRQRNGRLFDVDHDFRPRVVQQP